ncbi:unnamed protein product, partial [Urochloa humidicola]
SLLRSSRRSPLPNITGLPSGRLHANEPSHDAPFAPPTCLPHPSARRDPATVGLGLAVADPDPWPPGHRRRSITSSGATEGQGGCGETGCFCWYSRVSTCATTASLYSPLAWWGREPQPLATERQG